MQINAIHSLNFKGYNSETTGIPQEDYEIIPYEVDEDIDRFKKATELTNNLIKGDQKGPLAKFATVLGIGATSFTKGASVTAGIDKLSGDKASELFEACLKKGSSFAQNTAKTLKANEGKRLSPVVNFLGVALEKGENIARSAYKTISAATRKVIDNVDGDDIENATKNIKIHSAGKGMAMLAGITSAIALIPGMLKRDNNEDGVPDYKQKCQNVYAKNSKAIDKIGEKASVAVELAQLLT